MAKRGSPKQKRRPKLGKWLNAIQRLLREKKKTVQDLANEIKMPDQYIQIYRWLKLRKVEPGGEVTIILIIWALHQDPSLMRLFGIKTFSR